ncbi:DUF58 domain-containing protein [Pseudobacteriovorax antillogorgiicola]|uniref:DUF58 domain-containing protein n=1 Tax=Pseudobacteriovorax antillogorgiicola TaxID=1513793 RepID=A0A1Y6BSP7_9BACT|nr:DUF58 domain-containing protein [Pseudobacteriovorax antillogorgiicola]TCS53160.1 uncharacterized protein DUF58 [Pseudobacteriovorax antillogorgiicola]SMF25072.1 Protein of unknown function DUF58 [Pseudobacteriovorax antillogorgiicola]
MISPELRKQIKTLQLKAGHDVSNILAGEYVSAFKGRGMEFDEVREYFPGDDVRAIDWNVTARMGQPFIKVFREEREMTLMLMVDVSPSQFFGTQEKSKVEIAAELAAVLAFLAIRNNDRVGVILFSDHVEQYIPPMKGRSHIWNIIRSVLSHEPKGRATKLDEAISHYLQVIKRRSLCFLISDFLTEGYENKLKQLAARHDLVCVDIEDPREQEWVDAGLLAIQDSETGEQLVLDSGDPNLWRQIEEAWQEKVDGLQGLARKSGFDILSLRTNQSIVDGLMAVFKRRERRQRRR